MPADSHCLKNNWPCVSDIISESDMFMMVNNRKMKPTRSGKPTVFILISYFDGFFMHRKTSVFSEISVS